MITPAFGLTATERVLPRLALDFTTASLDPRITFTRTTGASNPATYVGSSGVITAATNNQPRFDYDPVTLVCKGLLIEESRTNSLLNTDLLSTQIVTVTAAVRTLSFYGTGSVTLSGAHTAVVSGTGAYPTRTTYSFTPTAGALTLTVAGTVQFAQLEVGAFATSYIPTTTTALTRNSDVAVMTGTNFSSWYNAAQGTFDIKFEMIQKSASTAVRYLLALDDSGGKRVVYINAGFTEAGSFDGTSVINPSGNVVAAASNITSAYNNSSRSLASNGNSVASGSVSASYSTATSLSIGSLSASSNANAWLSQLSFYPQRLTLNEIRAFSK